MLKKLILFLLWGTLLPAAYAQMGLNPTPGLKPIRDVEIYSRNEFIVQRTYIPSTESTAGIYVMNCSTNTPYTAAVGTLVGPVATGNYPASFSCVQQIGTTEPTIGVPVGYEITFGSLNTEANGDSVIIEDMVQGRIAFSGNTLPPVLLVPYVAFRVRFISDADGNVGTGFALGWRKVELASSLDGVGTFSSLQFDLTKGTLVGGLNDVGAIQKAGQYATALGLRNKPFGDYSTALGGFNTASGDYSTAMGRYSQASGQYASALGNVSRAYGIGCTALGYLSLAEGAGSTALGHGGYASGLYATALGDNSLARWSYATSLGAYTTASREYAVAIGQRNLADGNGSTTIGNYLTSAGFNGPMLLGDNSTVTSTSATASNQFSSRFAGGYRLLTNSAASIGVSLGAGGTSWATISDSTRKEHFRSIEHAQLLQKINALRLGTWNYKGQPGRRHYGPMAQEFFALFGHDELGVIGCDTTIENHDFTAVTLAGVQALAKENERLKTRIAQLRTDAQQRTDEYEARKQRLIERIEQVEAVLLNRPSEEVSARN